MHSFSKSLLISALFFGVCTTMTAEQKIYRELRTPKPENFRKYSIDEFKIDHNRVAAMKTGMVYGDREGLRKLARFYEENEMGRKYWKSRRQFAVDLLNDWYFKMGGFDRHIYWSFQMESLSIVYALTGHEALGKFLHDHIMQIARLPMDFWCHKELRSYKPERPQGMIETGQLSWKLSCAMSGAEDLFTPEELAEVRTALREKGLIPMLNYLEDTKAVNNFIAIVGTGTYITGKYLGDDKARETGKAALLKFVNGSVEDDGSYGEGTGYFAYPMNNLMPAVAAMSPAERTSFFDESGLRNSPEWLAYPYLYASAKADRALRVVYGDNSYLERPAQQLLAMLSDIRGDKLASWLGQYFSGIRNYWQCTDWRWAVVHLANEKDTPPLSPEEAKLPPVRGFENGENFIRSSWEQDGIVLSLYTAGLTRVGYAHQRPERNSVNLGAYGEYFIISPHSASYRSQIHYDYDLTSLAANTVIIDGRSQLFPKTGGSWGKAPEYATVGRPEGRLLRAEAGPLFDILEGDAKLCYEERPETATRTVLYHREKKFFVVIDRMKDVKAPHIYTARWQLNNRDRNLRLSGAETNEFLAERPKADLAVSSFSGVPLKTGVVDGYMHGAKRDYSPGGQHEGRPGSAKVLTVSNAAPVNEFTLLTVLQPLKKGEKPLPCTFDGKKLTVGGETIQTD